MIAFLGWNDDNYDVYVMNADGSGQTNVTRSRADESSVRLVAQADEIDMTSIPKGGKMKVRHAVFVALVAAVTLTSVAAAGPDAAKQRVAIDMKIYPQDTFVLTPLQAGPAEARLGHDQRATGRASTDTRDARRPGSHDLQRAVTTLTGKRGTLTIRDRNEWVDLGRDGNGDGETDGIGIGTWKVVRGTGQYAGIVGKGRNAHIGLGNPWYARYDGFLTSP